jgi:hypothetical protein
MVRSDRLALLVAFRLFSARPPRWRPAARSRLVTGRSRRGCPYAVTARHGPSRPVTSLSRPSRRRAGGPGPLALATLELLVHETLACATGVPSLCAARAATSARATLRCPAFGRVAAHVISPRPQVASSIQNVPRHKMPAAGQKLPRRHRRQDRTLAAARRLGSKSPDRLHRAPPPRSRPVHVRMSASSYAFQSSLSHSFGVTSPRPGSRVDDSNSRPEGPPAAGQWCGATQPPSPGSCPGGSQAIVQ